MSRDLLRRVAKVEVSRRADGLKGLSEAQLEERIASARGELVASYAADLRAGRPVAEVVAEVREGMERFPEAVAEILAALGLAPDEVPA